ncbi:MAG TPA: ribonuclease P protein component 1 [Candidatus Bathyarchaeia archaeon]|nr:ribonuclease P protein component 1 [Candidatus Bathyarchaeia archaeon]
MNVTAAIVRYELIGTHAKISKSSNSDCVGLSGKVMDETRNTFNILQDGKTKTAIKNDSVFQFRFHDGTVVEIDGRILVGRPEDRVKKVIRRLW